MATSSSKLALKYQMHGLVVGLREIIHTLESVLPSDRLTVLTIADQAYIRDLITTTIPELLECYGALYARLNDTLVPDPGEIT